MVNNPYQQYQRTQAETASKGRLVIMLYQGALRFINKAILENDEGNLEETHASAIRAQDIITELMTTLNMDAGPVAMNLRKLYQYMLDRLVQANVKKDSAIFQEVADLLRELLPAWEEAVRMTERSTAENHATNLRIGELQLALR